MPTLTSYPHNDVDWATIYAWIDTNNPALAAALAEGTPPQKETTRAVDGR